MTDPVCTIEDITPALAAEYLASNLENNRDINQAKIDRFARAIEEGSFALTHQGIAFDRKGNLIDGQHRLHAIVRAGKTVRIMVARGLAKETFAAIDIGGNRTLSDVVGIISNGKISAEVTKAITSYLRHAVVKNYGAISAQQIADVYAKLGEHFEWAVSLKTNRLEATRWGALQAALAVYHSQHPVKAQQFADQLISGAGLLERSPIFHLREALITGAIASKDADAYWKPMRAIVYHRDGVQMDRLYAAVEDLVGNKLIKEAQRRAASRRKAVETRQAKTAFG